MILSRDIDDKRILQSDWLRACWDNWKTSFFPDMRILQSHKEHCYAPFLAKKRRINGWIFKSQKALSDKFFRFSPKIGISEKLDSINFWALNPLCKISEKIYERFWKKIDNCLSDLVVWSFWLCYLNYHFLLLGEIFNSFFTEEDWTTGFLTFCYQIISLPN